MFPEETHMLQEVTSATSPPAPITSPGYGFVAPAHVPSRGRGEGRSGSSRKIQMTKSQYWETTDYAKTPADPPGGHGEAAHPT
ncbi:hypothetical protein E2C01_036428 [Portunus trituberculatus]|uniref:Uncharacterized protein n=1 Tax=Portunus trituberculatus TaxID=210409 RepID=A0A5B7FB52_PORTR|nr:hypothetical protein [Portunus trituberculatus]